MDPQRWARVRAVFESVADLPPEARSQALAAAAADDPALEAEVLRLLDADAPTALDAGIAPSSALLQEALQPALAAPPLPVLGRWRLLRELGSGGMGTVWLGERSDVGFVQQAAIKLIKARHAPASVASRFAAEQRMLARLTHPHIARLIDGGMADDGQPYLALEYVAGTALTQHAEQAALDPLARVRLFLDVCAAVAHAHQQLIVHRDLKPSNILVSTRGEVKLLDFGIAKLIGELEEDDPGLTGTGVRLYTPGYAAPEQLRGEPVSTATDVYALGVVLYELLAGRLPHAVHSRSPADWERAVLSEEPTPPSREATPTQGSPGPRTSAAGLISLPRALRGDLDAIVLKALRREPAQRYPAVTALAADLQAVLEGRPVSARRGSRRYRLGKFLRRHALAVTLGSCALLAVLAGAAISIWQARVAQAERDHARRQALTAERSTRFLVEVFKLADPSEAHGQQISARDLLDRGARSIDHALNDEPEVRSHLLLALGSAYGGLGLGPQALDLAQRAWADAQSSPDPVLRARALQTLAAAHHQTGDAVQGRAAMHQALDIELPDTPQAQALRAELEVAKATSLMTLSRFEEARPWFEAGLARERRVLGAPRPDSVVPWSGWLHAQGQMAEAEAILRDTLERVRRERAPADPIRVALSAQYASNLSRQGRHSEAIALQREAIAAKQLIYGDTHPSVDLSRHNLGKMLGDLGRYDEAIALYTELLPRMRAREGVRHTRTAAAEAALARIYIDTDRPELALPLWDAALASALQQWGETVIPTAIIRLGRGRTWQALGQPTQALADLDLAIATSNALGPNGRDGLARALSERARVRLALAELPAALSDARAGLAAAPESAMATRGYAQAVLAEALLAHRDVTAARSALEAGMEVLRTHLPANAAELRYAEVLKAKIEAHPGP